MSPDPTLAKTESFEAELLRVLHAGGLAKDDLNELVRIAVTFHREGLRPVKVFPLGIPVVDGVEIHSILPANGVLALLQKILIETPRTTGVAVFPYGIPNPEMFQVNIRLGGGAGRVM